MGRWTGVVSYSVVASGTSTNVVIPWRAGYSRYTVYWLRLGALWKIGDAETWR